MPRAHGVQICCGMKDLAWKTRKKKFPYVKSSGRADARADAVTFVLALDILGKESGQY